MKQQPCNVCGTTLRVKYRQVFPRHYQGEEACMAVLCDDCADQYHWKPRSKRVYRGSPPSFGYRSVNGQVFQDEYEIQVVEEIIRRRLSGESFATIAEVLEMNGVHTKNGGRWSGNTVTAIFEREAPRHGVKLDFSEVSPTRFGYCLRDGRVVPHEEEQKVICWILRARQSGRSYRQIAERLNEYNVPTKRDGVWSIPLVSTIVRRAGAVQ